MDESFDVGDAERIQIEGIAEVAIFDDITTCSCPDMCLREKGRNACPCKTIGQYCNLACHHMSSACRNRRRYFESGSDSSEQTKGKANEFEDISVESVYSVQMRSRGRSSTRGRPNRARALSRGAKRGQANANRGRGRARGRGRGGGRLVEEDDSQQRIMAHDQQLQAYKFDYV